MNPFTAAQKLTIIKHLAGGKPAAAVATIMSCTEADIIEVARNHGYPDTDKLAWAADILEKKIDAAQDESLAAKPMASEQPGAVRTRPGPVRSIDAVVQEQIDRRTPDPTTTLLAEAKGHQSKRIQAAADRALDAIGKVRDLLREDQEKYAAKRQIEAEKAAARAEVDKLERQLAAAKAKLRGKPATKTSARASTSGEPSAAEIRQWAADNDIDCPPFGRVPNTVRDAYASAHIQEAS